MKVKILILGSTGMLGSKISSYLFSRNIYRVYPTIRGKSKESILPKGIHEDSFYEGVDADNLQSVYRVLADTQPNIVINCIGIIKQLPEADDAIRSITINSLFPHRLAMACKACSARLIQISTDCVFSGEKGAYSENDLPDPLDLYGRTKALGEVNYPHCLTLRTSIVGHELHGHHSLIDWFLSQRSNVKGFRKAIYTGFPTVEMARIIAEYVIPNQELSGLYHVSSEPISKYDLLKMVANRYSKPLEIEPFDEFRCDRSLDSTRFRSITGYIPPSWPEMIDKMWRDFQENY